MKNHLRKLFSSQVVQGILELPRVFLVAHYIIPSELTYYTLAIIPVSFVTSFQRVFPVGLINFREEGDLGIFRRLYLSYSFLLYGAVCLLQVSLLDLSPYLSIFISLPILFVAYSSVERTLYRADLNFKPIVRSDMTKSALNLIVIFVLLTSGFKLMALFAVFILTDFIELLILRPKTILFRPKLRRVQMNQAFSLGLSRIVENFFATATQKSHFPALALFVNAEILGVYIMGNNITQRITTKIVPLFSVIHPYLERYKISEQKAAKTVLWSLIMVGLGTVVSYFFIQIALTYFDVRWQEASVYILIFSLNIYAVLVRTIIKQFALRNTDTKVLNQQEALSFIFLLITISLGYFLDLSLVAIAYLIGVAKILETLVYLARFSSFRKYILIYIAVVIGVYCVNSIISYLM